MDYQAKKLLEQFQCEYNRELEENFAKTLAENERARLFFINGNGAFTDGRNIVVDPAADELFCDTPALEDIRKYLKWPAVVFADPWNVLRLVTRAQTIHECLHLLYSDFPPPVTRDSLCATKNKKKVMGQIANIMEDCYIEAVGCSCYDNMEFYLKFGRINHLFARHPDEGTAQKVMEPDKLEKQWKDPEKKAQEMKKMALLLEYLNHMCTLVLYPMLEPGEPSAEVQPYVEATKELFFQGSVAPSCKERYAYAQKIFQIILPLIPDDALDIPHTKLDDLLSDPKTHEGNSSVGGEAHEGRSQVVTVRLFTNLDGTPRDDAVPLEQLMAELEKFAREKNVALQIVLDPGKFLKFTGSQYDCSVLHKDIHINENHPKIDMNLRKAYLNIYHKYKVNINSYNSRFVQLLRSRVPTREDKYLFGSGIASRMLGDPKKRYWYRMVEGMDVPDMAILLLIDGSGSMRGPRLQAAREAAVILHEVLKDQGMPHAIVEHRARFEDPEVDMNVLVDFAGRDQEKYNLMQIDAYGDNRDALALFWAERYMHQQTSNEYKLLLVLSDGLPVHEYDEYFPPVSTKDTANAVKKIMKRGTDIVAVSLDDEDSFDCYDCLKEIYPNLIGCNDLTRLTGQLLGVIARLL